MPVDFRLTHYPNSSDHYRALPVFRLDSFNVALAYFRRDNYTQSSFRRGEAI